MAIDGVDIETLLTPISAEAPAGVDVRSDFSPTSNYFRLRDARAEARAAERAAESGSESESGAESWRNVKSLALKILSEQSKDLEVAAWLTEALLRSNGLAGLAAGAEIIGGLSERYWDQLYPMPDEDGMETRVAPVTGLNGEGGDGTLSQPLYKLPLFRDGNGEMVMVFQYEQSAELETISDPKRLEARLRAGVPPYDQMQAWARATPGGNFVALRRDLNAARTAWSAMAAVLDQKAGQDSPPTRRISDTLEQISRIVERYAPPEGGAAAAADEPEAAGDAPAAAGGGGGGTAKARRLATREDALAMLAEAAEWFRKNEPQSPLAYTIDDAVRRGRMSWPDLIAELVNDETTRRNILLSLGIKAG